MACCCQPALPAAPTQIYGVVYNLFCFVHDIVPEATAQWLLQLPLQRYIHGVAGSSRKGKSYLSNQLTAAIVTEIPDPIRNQLNGCLRLPVDTFTTSDRELPQTRGIQLLALPRIVEGRLAPDQCWLVCDAEGLDLGDVTNHRAILGSVSRISSAVTYVETGEFSDNVISHLGRLFGVNAILNDDPTAVHRHLPLPALIVVLNKYGLRPFASPAAESDFFRNQLELNLPTTQYRPERALLRNQLTQNRLVLHTVPMDQNLNADPPGQPAPLTAQATQRWITSALLRTTAFPLPLSAQGFVDYLGLLLRGYRQMGPAPDGGSVLETLIRNETERIAARANEEYKRRIEEEKLLPGSNQVDGARGAPSDHEANAARNSLAAQHATIKTALAAQAEERASGYRDKHCDHVIDSVLRVLRSGLDEKEVQLLAHWDHMRAINPDRSSDETKVVDSNQRQEKIGEGGRSFVIFGPHEKIYATLVDRTVYLRTTRYRFNGDMVVSDWRVLSFSTVMIA